jgi:Superinfection immunity protein
MEAFVALLGFLLFGTLYFLPFLVADRRRHRNAGAIFVLTLCLGWTFLGWVAALIWAFTDNVRPHEIEQHH